MAETGSRDRRAARRWMHRLLTAIGALALLLVIAYGALRLAYPPARLGALLADQVRTLTGRELRIEGGLSVRLLPTIAIEAGDVVLANPAWASAPDMLRARRVAFAVPLRPLLHGEVRVESVDLQGADLWLETDAEGRVNWRFEGRQAVPAPVPATAQDALPPLRLSLDGLEASEVRVTFSDQRRMTTYVLGIETLALAKTAEGARLDAELAYGGGHWKLGGTTGAVEGLFHGGNWPFDFEATSEGAKVSARGSLGTGESAGGFEAATTVRFDTAAALETLGIPAASWPMPIEGSAQLRRSRERLEVEGLRLSIAGQVLSGKGVLQTGAAGRRLDAELSADALDLGAWQRAAGGAASSPGAASASGSASRSTSASASVPGSAPAQAARGVASAAPRPPFGDRPLPNLHLPGFPATLALRIDRLSLPGLPPISAIDTRLVADPVRLVADPLRFGVAGGQVGGRWELVMRPDAAPRTELQVDASGLSVEAIAAAFNDGRRPFADGRARLALKLSMTGRTPRSMAASASGSVLFTARDVALTDHSARQDQGLVARVVNTLIPSGASSENWWCSARSRGCRCAGAWRRSTARSRWRRGRSRSRRAASWTSQHRASTSRSGRASSAGWT